ncbi:SwmB domain-containing protein, partial [Verminephrobacter aporrectodeae]|uniref:SwmB domain-containing protein n=1 Tax=Verminephrobacter aporrectodeae TaxID=1110389 RepID=UPI002244A35A
LTVDATAKTVTLHLDRDVDRGEAVTVSYTKPAGDNVLQDAAGNDAGNLIKQVVTNNSAADTTAPVLGTATVSGHDLVLIYTEASSLGLDAIHTAGATDFAVNSASGLAIRVNSLTVDATTKTVTLHLDRDVDSGEAVNVSYTKPAGDNVLQDAAGNDAGNLTKQLVTNNSAADHTAPVLGTATVNGHDLVLSYTEASSLGLSQAHAPGAAAFAVRSTHGPAIGVDSVAVDTTAKTVTLHLSRDVNSGEVVNVSYTKPAGNDVLEDAAGNDAANLSNRTVDNLTPASAPAAPSPRLPDTDNDSVPGAEENQAIDPAGAVNGDGNADGIADSTQSAVGSISVATSSSSSTSITLVADSQDGDVSADSAACITSLEQKAPPADLPRALETPIELTSFRATLETAGSSETFSLFVDPATQSNGYWVEDRTGTWVNLTSAPYGGKMATEGERLRLDFQITDGGQFDADGKADGVITAPGAAGHMPLSIVGQAPDPGHDGFWL